jgi:hypothetical protein
MKQDLMEMLDGPDCCETFQYAELLTDEFISKNTSFRTVHEFFVYPFAPEDCTFNELDNYVKNRSNFQTWNEFLSAARRFARDSN